MIPLDKANPESIINAAVAAIAAQQAAWQAFLLTAILFVVVVIVVIMVVIILVKLDRVEKHTNSMHDNLVKATRAAGLMEGEKIGRQAEREDTAHGGKHK